MPINDHRGLIVWQKALDLAIDVYRVSALFPGHERFGLTQQLRRAATSIPSNIAEGNGRGHLREYVHFLYVANGSLRELSSLLELALALEYLAPSDSARLAEQSDHISRMLRRLIRRLREHSLPASRFPHP